MSLQAPFGILFLAAIELLVLQARGVLRQLLVAVGEREPLRPVIPPWVIGTRLVLQFRGRGAGPRIPQLFPFGTELEELLMNAWVRTEAKYPMSLR